MLYTNKSFMTNETNGSPEKNYISRKYSIIKVTIRREIIRHWNNQGLIHFFGTKLWNFELICYLQIDHEKKLLILHYKKMYDRSLQEHLNYYQKRDNLLVWHIISVILLTQNDIQLVSRTGLSISKQLHQITASLKKNTKSWRKKFLILDLI